MPSLLVTDRAVDGRSGEGVVLRVTSFADVPGTVDPKRLGALRAQAASFIADDPNRLVVLDCLDCLILHNGPERVERMLADLHDDVTVHGASLIVVADPDRLNPRLLAWLEREFDSLPVPATAMAAPLV